VILSVVSFYLLGFTRRYDSLGSDEPNEAGPTEGGHWGGARPGAHFPRGVAPLAVATLHLEPSHTVQHP
jgi:hypothetical protein